MVMAGNEEKVCISTAKNRTRYCSERAHLSGSALHAGNAHLKGQR